MQFAAMSASYNFRFHFWKWKCGETNRGRSRGSSSSSITRLQKLCHVFSLFLAYCGLGSLTANSSARIVFASCLPGTVCVLCPCLCDIFPLQFSLSHSLSALWHAHCKAPFCLPACRHGNFITCPQICEAHSLRLFLSLSLTHTYERTNSRPAACRSLSTTSHWAAILMCASEWASMPKRTRRVRAETAAAERERALLCPALSAAERRVDSASRRIWKRVSQSLAHLRRFSCFRALGAFVWFLCVHGRSRRVRFAGPTILQTHTHINTYTIHTHRNKQHQNQHLIRIEKENRFSVCALRAFEVSLWSAKKNWHRKLWNHLSVCISPLIIIFM